MNIDSIKNGFVIDHIPAGMAMEVYRVLKLKKLNCPVAMIMNAVSGKMGKKDIIKIDGEITLNFEALGYVAPDVTVNIIKDGKLVEKRHIELPEKITNVIKCKNPRCITSVEPGIDQVFKLTDKDARDYRCIYCESKAN